MVLEMRRQEERQNRESNVWWSHCSNSWAEEVQGSAAICLTELCCTEVWCGVTIITQLIWPPLWDRHVENTPVSAAKICDVRNTENLKYRVELHKYRRLSNKSCLMYVKYKKHSLFSREVGYSSEDYIIQLCN